MPTHTNTFPKLHNAAWPGVVGKGPDSEPAIDLDTMLALIAVGEATVHAFESTHSLGDAGCRSLGNHSRSHV